MEPNKVKSIISVRHLRKVYRVGDEKVIALGDINLEIPRGQIVCIIGTSGSGKSTLLNQLAGLEKPTKGCVYIGKTNISKMDENQLALFRQQRLGFVFQSYNLLPTMTAIENVALPMIFKGIGKAQRNKAALKMLAAVGLKKRAYHRPTQMSGGQQQRVGIARAFVARPSVVFADEPTGNLDSKTTIDVMKTMVNFSRKYQETLIIVTHDPEIADYADRVVTLIDGAITSDVTHEPIYAGPDIPMELPQVEALSIFEEDVPPAPEEDAQAVSEGEIPAVSLEDVAPKSEKEAPAVSQEDTAPESEKEAPAVSQKNAAPKSKKEAPAVSQKDATPEPEKETPAVSQMDTTPESEKGLWQYSEPEPLPEDVFLPEEQIPNTQKKGDIDL